MMNILELKNINKKFVNKQVLNNVSIKIEEGQIVGLLGPNGSGKTTLIKIINNLITDFEGEVLICNRKLDFLSRNDISYLPDKEYIKDSLKIKEVIKIFSSFFENFDTNKAYSLIDILNLNENDLIKTLSKGMLEKLNLSLILAKKAKLYIFDEPLSGIDPAAREFIIESIISNYEKDSSVLISTHLITDIEPIIDRAIFINNGEIILDKNIDVLREERNKSLNEIFKEEFRCLENY